MGAAVEQNVFTVSNELFSPFFDLLTGWPLVLESPGKQNSPGKLPWESEKLRKSPGTFFRHQQIFKISLCCIVMDLLN